MLFFWVPILWIVAAIVLVVLKLSNKIDWDWIYVLIPFWLPLVYVVVRLMWFLIPFAFLVGTILLITGGKPI